jgi:glycerophosphoryl diester phosphodiesterase
VAALIIAHRGGAPHLGENTAAAFQHGIQCGADMLEMDVQRSADGHLVVIHDSTIEISNGTRRPVSMLPLGELRRTLPELLTFDEYLEQFGTKMYTNVDIKGEGFEADVVRAIRRHDLTGRVLVSSRDAASLRRVRLLAPEARIGLSRGQIVPWLAREPHSAIAAGLLRPTLPVQLIAHGRYALASAFMLHFRLIQPWLVRYLHARGYRVFCWTANDPAIFRSLDEAGVDGIATDHPERMVEFLR